jgi:hypothetical protein
VLCDEEQGQVGTLPKEEKMHVAIIRRTWRRQLGCTVRSAIAHITLIVALLLIPQAAFAQAEADFEKPPVLNVKDLIPEKLLQGKGFHVQDKVPTDGVMGTYTLIADKDIFGEDAGTYQVRSREMLELRLAEIPAIIKLDETSKVGTFAKSMAASAARPLESAGQMVMHPVDTVTGLPSGVGRLFERVDVGATRLWDTATDSNKGGLERTKEVAEQTGTITRNVLGYEQDRRELAKKLGVDPYTTNPVLAKKLDAVATAAFRGRFGVNTLITVFVPASIIITGVRVTDDLVWDTPRGDLIVRVENKLKELQVPPVQSSLFMHNAAIPLSLQVAVVEQLSRLGGVKGREEVIGQMGSLATESQARFLATSIRMLTEYHEKKKPIIAIAAPGPIIARDQDGALILPGPVDYISWTERVAHFAKNPDFAAAPQRIFWLTGGITPRAKKEFEANGWTIHEGKNL